MKDAQAYWNQRVIQNKVRMRILYIHSIILRTIDVEQCSPSSNQALSSDKEDHFGLDNNASTTVREGSCTSDDVFLEDHVPYGSPGNPIDDCGVVEIDLVSTEVPADCETVEEAEHYNADYEAAVFHTGAEPVNSEYSIPEAEGELPIIIEENKAAINLARNFEMLKAPATMSHVYSMGADKRSNKVNPPPNQMQILAASLAGKRLDMLDSFQPGTGNITGSITVSRKTETQSSGAM